MPLIKTLNATKSLIKMPKTIKLLKLENGKYKKNILNINKKYNSISMILKKKHYKH